MQLRSINQLQRILSNFLSQVILLEAVYEDDDDDGQLHQCLVHSTLSVRNTKSATEKGDNNQGLDETILDGHHEHPIMQYVKPVMRQQL